MKKPKVSLVIPVYKGANYMREAIDSALAQTYENLEIIVVNDGSKDGGATDSIARSYGDKIRYFSKENGGVSTALNLAIKNMKGEYFTWLSHDDIYLPNKVESQVNYLIENHLVGTKTILYADYALINENSILISNQHKSHHLLNEHSELSLLTGAINGLTLFIPKIAFNECGLFDEKLRCVQDYQLWFEFLKKGYKFIHQDMIFTATRLHQEQTTNVNPLVVSEGEAFWQEAIKYYEKKSSEKIYGSKYVYYQAMHYFFRSTPYDNLTEMTHRILEKEEKKNEKNNDLISVVISFNKGINYLIRSIKSVLKSDYKNIEIIIIDNNSKEKNKELNTIVSKNKNLRFIKRKDNNLISGINEGIKASKGAYIAFLNNGDEFKKEKLSIQLKKMKTAKTILSHTSFEYLNNDEKTYINSGLQNGPVQYDVISENRICFSTVMIDAKFIKDKNMLLNEKKENGGYECFYLQILSNKCALGIDEALSIIHDESTNYTYTNDYQIKRCEEILDFVLNDRNLSTKRKNIENLIHYLNGLYELRNITKYNLRFDYTMYIDRAQNEKSSEKIKPVKKIINIIKRIFKR